MKHLFVIATGSAGKIRDFAHILETDHYEFKTLKDIGFDEDIIENGNTFAENAIIKSNTTAQWLAKKNIEATVLADDSGLEVFALNGEPGIYSARYCGKHGDDEANNVKLMQKLEGIEDRKARYFCALYQTVTQNGNGEFVISEPIIFEGECRGEINHAPVGDMGFGYDPLFVPDGETRTFAQMELEEKKLISHRGNAIRALKKLSESKKLRKTRAMLKILFAPLQGYTTGIYRKAHADIFGGVDAYYAPFLRIENGKPREKDLRNLDATTIPQIIANSVDEFKSLANALIAKGYTEIDFNMGCPFPMQVNRHCGAGLLSNTQAVQAIMDEIKKLSSTANETAQPNANRTAPVKFSIKMRLGQNSPDEAFALLPILNETPLAHITIHPRLGKQQYKGAIDFNSFERFYNKCTHSLVYNGDITSVSQICEMERRYPKLAGVMIGRGMLAQPSLAAEYKGLCNTNRTATLNCAASSQSFLGKILQMHDIIFNYACKTYQGDSQILSHIQTFWEYLEPNIPKKIFKRIKKAGKLNEYNEAIAQLK